MKFLVLTILSTFLTIKVFASTLVSHKAYYKLLLEKTESNSLLEGGEGNSTFFFQKGCEGWTLKENFLLSYSLSNNKTSNTYSIFKTFEDFSSKNFSFEHHDKSDVNGIINYQGYLKKKGNNLSGKLIESDITDLNYQDKILLPTEHLIKLLKYAKNNKKILYSNVFFGSSKDSLVKKVSAVIGNKKKIKSDFRKKVKDRYVWPINLAFFNYNSKKSSPETQIKIDIDQGGVVYNYEVDYGDYKMYANLVKLDSLTEKKC